MNSDSEISITNQESTYLALLATLQKSDLLIYFEVIQNTHINDEIFSSSDEVFVTKEQLSHVNLHMKNLIKSASYKEAMNSSQHNH